MYYKETAMEKVIEIKNITKIYNLYDKPTDRLKEVLFPKFSKHKEFSASLEKMGVENLQY